MRELNKVLEYPYLVIKVTRIPEGLKRSMLIALRIQIDKTSIRTKSVFW